MTEENPSSRLAFVISKGVSGRNARAWSFVNENEKFVIFGAWENLRDDSSCLIFSDDWKTRNGRAQGGYTHSKKHIELILEDGFKLFTFSQIGYPRENSSKPSRIKDWTPKLEPKELYIEGGNYFAVDIDHGNNEAKKPPVTSNSHKTYWEGNETSKLTTEYERNPMARQACLDKYDYVCQVCKMNFVSVYGQIGQQFIHVHHIVPVSKRTKPYEIDPLHDLVPLCPNCHSMVHKRIPPFTIAEMRKIISDQMSSST